MDNTVVVYVIYEASDCAVTKSRIDRAIHNGQWGEEGEGGMEPKDFSIGALLKVPS